jgi:predicted transcriptional regulator
MRKPKIQDLKALRAEMKAVAKGERKAPRDAGRPSFNSVEALMRLLTAENRRLLETIRSQQPQSIAELSLLSGRGAANLTRTLLKLSAAGLVEMRAEKRRKIPVATAKPMRVEIDPYGKDRIEFA